MVFKKILVYNREYSGSKGKTLRHSRVGRSREKATPNEKITFNYVSVHYRKKNLVGRGKTKWT
ncbi:MAG: hypothetical protein A2158_07365 [Chloroflexi bacterium RBG_13_46_14]|nr:MAG: hypothetical protein A2158_07365 [Chloroflexi bacterium RBG_13_46_14]